LRRCPQQACACQQGAVLFAVKRLQKLATLRTQPFETILSTMHFVAPRRCRITQHA
jgi:hypothetical protein